MTVEFYQSSQKRMRASANESVFPTVSICNLGQNIWRFSWF